MLPVILDFREKNVVVFGGGEVGYRKASFFSREADVTVISKEFIPAFDKLNVARIREDVFARLEGWVEMADFIVAATDSHEVNAAIEEECSRQRKWCNNALGVSDFLIPSVVERDGYMVAVSTQGRSPAMSKFLRLRLDELLPAEYSTMIVLQEELRTAAKDLISDQKEREKFLWDVLQDESIWAEVRKGSLERSKKMAMAKMVTANAKDP